MIIRGKNISLDQFSMRMANSRLSSVEIIGTGLSCDIYPILAKCAKLKEVTLFNNWNLTDDGLENILDAPSLKSIFIHDCRGISTAFLNRITDNVQLRELYLEGCNVIDQDMQNIGKLKVLWSLNLSNTNVTDIGLRLINNRNIDLLCIED